MNDIISKWNREIRHIEQETRESVDIKQYVMNKDIKIIDLKYLEEIKYTNMMIIIDRIIKDYKDIFKNNSKGMYPCPYYLNVHHNDKCKNYHRCLLCNLDYLIDVKRIQIIKKV